METTSILITGDFVPHGRILNMVKGKDISHVFNEFSDYLINSDINITNLECPLLSNAEPIKKIGPLLKAPTESVGLLKKGRIDIVTLANNHILDFGIKGIKSTIEICKENGISTVGAGLNKAETIKPLIVNKNSKTIGIINFAESEFSVHTNAEYGANPFDFSTIFKNVVDLKKTTDIIIVIAHGGHEFYKYPSPDLVKRYRFLIDIGANVVVGHHPHCYSGYEKYNKGFIFYSLGNFCFDWPAIDNPDWNEGYAVKLSINTNNEITFDLIPYKQGTEIAGLSLLNENEKKSFDNDISQLNEIISSDESLKEKWGKFVSEMEDKYLSMIQPTNRWIKALQSRNLLPKIFYRNKRNRLMLLNLVRCESHREMLINILARENKK